MDSDDESKGAIPMGEVKDHDDICEHSSDLPCDAKTYRGRRTSWRKATNRPEQCSRAKTMKRLASTWKHFQGLDIPRSQRHMANFAEREESQKIPKEQRLSRAKENRANAKCRRLEALLAR